MIRLAVRVRREEAELALAELLALAPGGVEEVDLPGEGLVELAVYGAPGELPELGEVRAAVGGALVEVRTSVVGDDWAQRWRGFHQPVVVGGRLVVRAPWHAPAGDGALDVVVDPGQAFGTGAHATTRLCLELLLGLDPGPPAGLVDVGCGSGVLAIAAAKLGWAPVLGLDNQREAVEATLANAAANGVEVDARRWDLRRDALPAGLAGGEAVCANLLRPLLLLLAGRLAEAGRAPAVLVAGGLLAGEADEVAAAFAAWAGRRERARREAEGWAALLLSRAP